MLYNSIDVLLPFDFHKKEYNIFLNNLIWKGILCNFIALFDCVMIYALYSVTFRIIKL